MEIDRSTMKSNGKYMEINQNEDNIMKTYMKESRKKSGSRWKTCENQKKHTCEIYRRQMKIEN